MTNKIKFIDKCKSLPPSGSGACNRKLLGVARVAHACDVGPDEFLNTVRKHITGTRPVLDKEIMRAYKRAHDMGYKPQQIPDKYKESTIAEYRALFNKYRDEAKEWDKYYMREQSTIQFDQKWQAESFVDGVFAYDDAVALGFDLYDCNEPMDVASWDLRENQYTFFCINSLMGRRCKANVARMRYMLVEFDDLDIPVIDQAKFWCAAPFPIVSLVYSGGKSIHALIRVDCEDMEDWDSRVGGPDGIMARYFIPMGVDASTLDPCRLSRVPGAIHKKTGRAARLLYLAPEGKPVYE